MQDEEIQRLKVEVNELKAKTGRLENRVQLLESQLASRVKATSRQQDLVSHESKSSLAKQEDYANAAASYKNFFQQKKAKFFSGEFENLLGGTLFNRLGIIALLFALIFFFKFAFDNQWLGDTGKVALGIVFGILLLGGGEYYHSKDFRRFAYGFTGGGLAALYASIFASYQFYGLLTILPAFSLMLVITFSAIALALFHNSSAIATLGILGGFLTPFILKTPQPNAVGLFIYLISLNLVILGISIKKSWRFTHALGFGLSVLATIAWLSAGYHQQDLGITLTFVSMNYLIYFGVTLFYSLQVANQERKYDIPLLLANPTFFFIFVYGLLNPEWHRVIPFLAVFMAAVYMSIGYQLWQKVKNDPTSASIFFAVAAAFLGIAIPLQFSGYSVSLGWASEGLLLWYAGLLLKDRRIRKMAGLVAVITLFHLFTVDSYLDLWHLEYFWPLLNKRAFLFIFIMLVVLAAFYLYRQKFFVSEAEQQELRKEARAVKWLPKVAVALAFILLTMEATSYSEFQITQINKKTESIYTHYAPKPQKFQPYEQQLPEKVSLEIKAFEAKRQAWENIQSFSISGVWAVFALLFIILGMKFKAKFWRYSGIFLLVIVALKIFFIDLTTLQIFFRIVSLASLGVLMLIASYSYQRHQKGVS